MRGKSCLENEMKLSVKTSMNVALAGVMLSLALAAAPAYAAGPEDIDSFVACLNSINTTPQTVVDAVACVPSGCYTTLTLSGESAQPGCTLRDGTRLPRVIFSCPGPGGSQTLRFRPSFTLCTQGSTLINHIEVGVDVGTVIDSKYVQEMADIDSPPDVPSFQVFTEFGTGATAVVDAQVPLNSKGCAECHDRLGTASTGGNIFNLFAPVRPELAEGTIFTNDPKVVAPAIQTPLSDICNGVATSSQLARNPSKQALAVSLCDKLETKTH